MSVKRNKESDRARTAQVLAGAPRGGIVTGENWLGHGIGTGAANIDDMLVNGNRRDELEACAGREAVGQHLYHLRKEHGLCLTERHGKLMFDRVALDGTDET